MHMSRVVNPNMSDEHYYIEDKTIDMDGRTTTTHSLKWFPFKQICDTWLFFECIQSVMVDYSFLLHFFSGWSPWNSYQPNPIFKRRYLKKTQNTVTETLIPNEWMINFK